MTPRTSANGETFAIRPIWADFGPEARLAEPGDYDDPEVDEGGWDEDDEDDDEDWEDEEEGEEETWQVGAGA